MSAAKVVRLGVRASQRSHLAFDVEGVLEEVNVTLGQSVAAFDLASFYTGLAATVAGAPAELRYNSSEIHTALAGSALMSLRAEPRKATLDSAIAARANAFYAKYGSQAGIIALMNQFYAPASPGSKPARLAQLTTISQNQSDLLQAAYAADGRQGVIKSTTSSLSSLTTSLGESEADNTGLTVGSDFTDGSSSARTTDFVDDDTVSSGKSGSTNTSDDAVTTGLTVGTNVATSSAFTSDVQQSSAEAETVSLGEALQTQAITNTDYGYRIPSLENLAQNHRSQISLIDETFAQFMANQNLPFLPQVFSNELSILDLGVKQLQVAYLDTILISPINGVVTGVYRDLGDRVRLGDVAVRVENNQSVYLVGTLVHRNPINLGDTVTVDTTEFSNHSGSVSISGTVVGVRGRRSNDDWWSVIVSCNNLDSSGDPIFPLDYHFDYDDTTVTVS